MAELLKLKWSLLKINQRKIKRKHGKHQAFHVFLL
jgi:hypothetical protein